MIQEFDEVIFTVDLPHYRLVAGDVGTVVEMLGQGTGYQVEVFFMNGKTYDVVAVDAAQVRAVNAQDLHHARPLPEDPA